MAMNKGERTRASILDQAMAISRIDGLSGLTIGRLAEATGMSKSGLFAHFGSKEQLQQAVLERATEAFIQAVIQPALARPRGLPRIRAVFEGWVHWVSRHVQPGGCPLDAAIVEMDDRPGPLRDFLVEEQTKMRAFLVDMVRRAIAEGHLRPDIEPELFVFEARGILESFTLMHKLHRHPEAERWARTAFDGLVARSSVNTH